MSRVAKKPIALPKGVELSQDALNLTVKGPKGSLTQAKPAGVDVAVEGGELRVKAANDDLIAMAGTLRALLANMVAGVSEGYTRKLELVGVGYRASVAGRDLNLSLGFSHPVVFSAPEGITIETPSQTEILIKGADKQVVGQVAAKIRAFRPPEPYKGKGVRYSGEKIVMKEAKKA
ncbi:50S ribosomal protein L6 [Aquimonas voraii]|uniref:Large ribosomal subunit protein uL6 n=1 Tax=Aquimonas voraii TaxID=265719 RepID=A0A1G6YUD8_9GAMM|nr:50S ribosomal protein L6 [Aquimonas voraii]SDD93663.1 LSU ribosomal protein L6P [Aquimonas voraii]